MRPPRGGCWAQTAAQCGGFASGRTRLARRTARDFPTEGRKLHAGKTSAFRRTETSWLPAKSAPIGGKEDESCELDGREL